MDVGARHATNSSQLGKGLGPFARVVRGEADGFPDHGDARRLRLGVPGVRQRGLGVLVDERPGCHEVPTDALGEVLRQRPQFAPSLDVEVREVDGVRQLRCGQQLTSRRRVTALARCAAWTVVRILAGSLVPAVPGEPAAPFPSIEATALVSPAPGPVVALAESTAVVTTSPVVLAVETASLVSPPAGPVVALAESTAIRAPGPVVPTVGGPAVVAVPLEPAATAPVLPVIATSEPTPIVLTVSAVVTAAPTALLVPVERPASFSAVTVVAVVTAAVGPSSTAASTLPAATIAVTLVLCARPVVTTVRATGPVVTFAARAVVGHAFSYLQIVTRHGCVLLPHHYECRQTRRARRGWPLDQP
ncbi:hypothetical protein [Saccharomonospora sp. NB11]|uniref:hypothetical protein n=1 Tax=Saccharomonospora sp. NB11 TaxID=1642298 RepID=UPI001E6490FF|nr:hypothetical protein [Saccharomonospora sp. NB11]